MKNFKFILLGVIFLLLNSCSDDDSKLSENGLYQTQWVGILQFKEGEVNKECNVNISFETLTTGRYISDNLDESSEYSKQTTIEYEIKDKIISIYGGVHNILLGDWWIEKKSKGNLILKREPNTEYEAILTLNKL